MKLLLRKALITRSHTCRDLAPLPTSAQLKLSLLSSSDTEPAYFRVETTCTRSFSVKKRIVSGERGRREKEITPKINVNKPSFEDRLASFQGEEVYNVPG